MNGTSPSPPIDCLLCLRSVAAQTVLEAKDWEHGVPGVFELMRCPECGVHFMHPRPTRQQLNGYYPPTYAVYDDKSPISWLFRRVFAWDAKRVKRLIGPRGRILDVGCGNGGALDAMKGVGTWQLCGVELDPAAAGRARGKGYDVRVGDLEECDFEPESFDLIRMGHVIEHVLDPVRTLRKVRQLLKPGGTLLAETPNIDCWDFRVFRRYWGALHFPRHLVLFNDSTIRLSCARAGLEVVRVEPRMRTVGWSAGIQNFLVDKLGLRTPPSGRFWWYPLLIPPFLPMTLLQSLVSRPATLAFVALKPGSSGPTPIGEVSRSAAE